LPQPRWRNSAAKPVPRSKSLIAFTKWLAQGSRIEHAQQTLNAADRAGKLRLFGNTRDGTSHQHFASPCRPVHMSGPKYEQPVQQGTLIHA
jgi:hypothetical protein